VPFLPDVTVVVPTFNRPRFLAALLEYFSTRPVTFKIIVSDGSSPEVQEQNRQTAGKYPGIVDYRASRYGPDFGSAIERIGKDIKAITTEFAVFCADDDLLMPEGVQAAVEFLRGHPDFVAAHGNYFGASRPNPDTLNLAVTYASQPLDMGRPLQRLLALCTRYQSIFYAVQRTPDLIGSFPAGAVTAAHFLELSHAFVLVCRGKLMTLPIPYFIRNEHLGSHPQYDHNPMYFVIKSGQEYLEELLRFRDDLSRALTEFKDDGTDWRQIIDLGYFVFLARCLDPVNFRVNLMTKGVISQAELDELTRRSSVSNEIPVPVEALTPHLKPVALHGWPALY